MRLRLAATASVDRRSFPSLGRVHSKKILGGLEYRKEGSNWCYWQKAAQHLQTSFLEPAATIGKDLLGRTILARCTKKKLRIHHCRKLDILLSFEDMVHLKRHRVGQ